MKTIQFLALGLGILATGAHASSPILSVSNVVTDSLNLGLGATITTTSPTVSTYPQSDLHNNYISTNSTALTSEVQTAPTTSTAGLAYDYATVTTTSSWVDYRWKNDYLSVDVTSNGVNQIGNKWISLTGSVQSTIDTTLSFYLSAHGSFTAAQGPFGSAIAPLLASFYFGDAQPVALSATTNTNLDSLGYSTYSSSYSTASFNLLGGVAQNFVAYVYAPTDASISNFNLDARTSDYDLVTTPVTQTNIGVKTLIGAHTLAPIPEPETYGMMLAGLGLIGFMVSRRRGSL
ncbi:MAG: PEP-CTERM sorting domain-containing protein [Thiobacillus sp.]|nr:PEP-CTERM sorting domain-containing protein [Thiobacillus sp.]